MPNDNRLFIQASLTPGVHDDLIEWLDSQPPEVNKAELTRLALTQMMQARQGQPSAEEAIFNLLAHLSDLLGKYVTLAQEVGKGEILAEIDQVQTVTKRLPASEPNDDIFGDI